MALFTNSENKCVEALKDLHAHRGRLEATIVERETELTQLRTADTAEAALDSFLKGEVATGTARRMTIERQIADLTAARGALAGRIRAAITELAKTRAASLRKAAKGPEKELAAHTGKVAELLEGLQAVAGCKYVAQLEPDGDVAYDKAGGEIGRFSREPRQIPRAFTLQSEIARLNGEAAGIEARAAASCEGGQIAGESLDALLVVCDNPELLAPSRGSMEAWFTEASQRAEAEWARRVAEYGGRDSAGRPYGPIDHTVRFTLVWDAEGSIDHARSGASNHPVSGQAAIWNTQAAAASAPDDGRRVPDARQW